MRYRYSFPYLLIFVALLVLLLAFVQVGIFSVALDKLGISLHAAVIILFTSLAGSAINIPLFYLQPEHDGLIEDIRRHGLLHGVPLLPGQRVLVAINVGGAVIPVLVSFYLMVISGLGLWRLLLAVTIVSLASYAFSRPIRGVGIGMPVLIAPLIAATTALVIAPQQSAPLAYIAGTLGVLIGADIMRMRDVRRMGTALASIGGAGTFDGIYLTGILAVLLA